jgi:integrase
MQKLKKKRLPAGLIWRGKKLHIHAEINGATVRKTTGTDKLDEAQDCLDRLRAESRHQNLTGEPGNLHKTWADAVVRYFGEAGLTNEKNKNELKRKITYMRKFIPLDQPLNQIHNSTLEPLCKELKAKGRKAACVNSYKKLVRQILNKALKWEDAGIRWLTQPHNMIMEPEKHNPNPAMNRRAPYPLTWEEQDSLIDALPQNLKVPALFLVNSGLREKEATNLRWQWLVHWAELDVLTFLIPAAYHKNKQSKVVVLNSIAKKIIEDQRGKHHEFVFSHHGKQFARFNSSAWKRARDKVNLPQVRVHDLRHTFAHRLKHYGVGYEDRAMLLGHKVVGVTADYSFTAMELESMIVNVEKIVKRKHITFLRPNLMEKYDKNTQNPHSVDFSCV